MNKQPKIFEPRETENGFIFRAIQEQDLSESYFQLLSRLTSAPYPSENLEEMKEFFSEIEGNPNHQVIVIEDKESGTVIGTGTLLIERKFIRGISKVGHIEDIVINQEYSGKGLGKELIVILKEISEEAGCYKTILDSSDDKKGFYEKCGFEVKGVSMAKYV